MRKLSVFTALLICAACHQNESTTTTTNKNVRVHTNTIPADARNANIKEKLPLDIQVLERSALGTKLDKDGNVFESKDSFAPGEPVYVSMWLKQSPVGLQTSVEFLDEHGKEIEWPKKEMKGEKVVTFKLGKDVPAGEYHAKCYWGMNEEVDYPFRVEGKKKR